jgi:hypothetical protein
MDTEGLVQLEVPVPPQLEQAIGYEGNGRFVSFTWTPYGDEAYFDDGRFSGTGDWDGYLTFVQHPAVAPLLAGYQLGDSDREAKHALVLDRQERKLYAAPMREAGSFLDRQWPPIPNPEPVTMTKEEVEHAVLDALNIENWAEVSSVLDTAEITARMQKHQELVAQMKHWLDQQPCPQPPRDSYGRPVISFEDMF